MEQCEDAPCCGHVECGFGPGVPGYGSNVNGQPYFGEHKITPNPIGEVHDDTPMFCDRPSCMVAHAGPCPE